MTLPAEIDKTDSPDSQVMLSLRDVRVSYGEREILHGVTFDVMRGETLVILGGSGSGKSTLLRTLVGLEKPSSGEIWIKGKNIAAIPDSEMDEIRKKIGMSFQGSALFGSMTVGENVALPLRVLGKEESDYRAEVVELLQWVGLGDRMGALPPILSGGEKQRAAIARAVIARPQLLLADEPTGNVDPNLGQRLLRLFIELNKSGTSVVIATHDIALMDEYDARRLVLHEGRLHVYD